MGGMVASLMIGGDCGAQSCWRLRCVQAESLNFVLVSRPANVAKSTITMYFRTESEFNKNVFIGKVHH